MTKEVKFRWATEEEMKQTRYIEWRDMQEYPIELRNWLEHLRNIKHPETVTLRWKLK